MAVLKLLARGYLIEQICNERSIANITVRLHISSMLNKLNLRNQVQLVMWAHRKGIVKRYEINFGRKEF